MPRRYKRVTDKADVPEANMKLALESVLNKELSIRKAAEQYGVKAGTLQHRIEKKKKENELPNIKVRIFENKFTNKQVFTADEEKELEKYIKKSSAIQYGLTLKAVRKLAYEYACALPNCKYPEKWDEDKLAGIEWLNETTNSLSDCRLIILLHFKKMTS
uniref:HTH psq-type domain-containing protein n=1 Tax=Heliothis virescens TaxID=7102 RepID=A0A2A4JR59_HELVI